MSMKTYLVTNEPLNVDGPGFKKLKITKMRAESIGNLRKALCTKLKEDDRALIYSENKEFIGIIGNMGTWLDPKTPNGNTFLWISKGIEYKVSPTNGSLKRIGYRRY